MKKYNTYTFDTLPPDRTDWEKVRKLTDADIERAAATDPDNPILTKEELKKFKRVNEFSPAQIKDIREKLKMSQMIFAAYFGISARTLQDWEQGRRHPHGAARTLLTIIKAEPKLVSRVLNRHR